MRTTANCIAVVRKCFLVGVTGPDSTTSHESTKGQHCRIVNPQVHLLSDLEAAEAPKAAEARLAELEKPLRDEYVDVWPKPTPNHWPVVCTTETDWPVCPEVEPFGVREEDRCEDYWDDNWPDDAQTWPNNCQDDEQTTAPNVEDAPKETWQDDLQDDAQTTALTVEDAPRQTWWEEVEALTRCTARKNVEDAPEETWLEAPVETASQGSADTVAVEDMAEELPKDDAEASSDESAVLVKRDRGDELAEMEQEPDEYEWEGQADWREWYDEAERDWDGSRWDWHNRDTHHTREHTSRTHHTRHTHRRTHLALATHITHRRTH